VRFSLTLRVYPQSRKQEICVPAAQPAPEAPAPIRVYLTAPAVDSKANEALVRLMAKTLGVPKTAVTIARGEHSREKVIFIEAESLPEPYLSMAKRGAL
jgi:uncharacterized protein YggU (UPF0235/DUF167 family)